MQECDVYLGIEKYWTKTQEWARSVLKWQGIDDIIADELLAFPGMQELTVLLEILEHHKLYLKSQKIKIFLGLFYFISVSLFLYFTFTASGVNLDTFLRLS